jgi:hypothetical protein
LRNRREGETPFGDPIFSIVNARNPEVCYAAVAGLITWASHHLQRTALCSSILQIFTRDKVAEFMTATVTVFDRFR